MLGFLARQALAESVLRDFLQEIPVAESMPSFISGMFTRADTPSRSSRERWQERSLPWRARWLAPLEVFAAG